jgi:hypothetical protein
VLLNFRKAPPTRPLFVLGSQRSGTTMIADVLAKSPDCEVFLGEKRRLVFEGASRLVPIQTIAKLVSRSRRRVAVFKPNNDLQYANVFLDSDPNARIIWVYRDYRDAINSAVKRWGTAHRDIMMGIARGRTMHPGQAAIAEGVSDALRTLLQGVCHDDLTPEEGAALLWYARNSLYFDRHLDRNERVLLANYEDSVRNPADCFSRVFEFAGAAFKARYVRDVFGSSIGKQQQPVLGKAVETLCQAMMALLGARYDARFSAADQNRLAVGLR